MSTPNATGALNSSPLRRRTLAQGAKLVAKPLIKFISLPGVHEFVHNAQELIVALKAPGLNDASAAAIVSQIVDIAAMVGDAVEQLNSMDDAVATAYLERLRPFTGYLEQTRGEIDQYQQRSYTAKVALHDDMANLLLRKENDLRYQTLILCLEKSLLMDRTAAQLHHTIVQIRAQLIVVQTQATAAALNSASDHQRAREESVVLGVQMAALKAEMAVLKAELTELRMLGSRSNCPDIFGYHRSIFFLHPPSVEGTSRDCGGLRGCLPRVASLPGDYTG